MLEAEAAGEVDAAMRLNLQMPGPGATPQVSDLRELAHLGDSAPPWAIGRWITRQALRRLLFDVDPRVREAVIVTAVTMHPRVDLGVLPPDVLFEFGTHITTTSWVCGELLLHEMGGLEDFLDHRATPALLASADDVRPWCATPMSGYRLDRVVGNRLVVTDLRDTRSLEVLNIGAATGLAPAECVIGRLVAGSAGPMFESRPFSVPAVVAHDVAEVAADRKVERFALDGAPLPAWVSVLARHVEAGRIGAADDRLVPTPLTSDVEPEPFPPTPPGGNGVVDGDRVPTSPREAELVAAGVDPLIASHVCVCEVGLIAAQVSGLHGAGAAGPHVALCLVQPGVLEATLEYCTSPELEKPWRTLADSFTGPARDRAHQIADACRPRAA